MHYPARDCSLRLIDARRLGYQTLVAGGFLLARVAGSVASGVQIHGLVPIGTAAFVLIASAIVASVTPAARASRVDVIKALLARRRSETA